MTGDNNVLTVRAMMESIERADPDGRKRAIARLLDAVQGLDAGHIERLTTLCQFPWFREAAYHEDGSPVIT